MSFFELTEIVVAAAATASVLRKQVRTKRSLLPSGVILWSMACLLQVQIVYGCVDHFFGDRNFTNLIYRSMAIIAVALLDVMVIRATRSPRHFISTVVVVGSVTCLVLVIQGGIFFSNRWPGSNVYLAAYGGQLGREAYWSVMMLSVGYFAAHVLVTVGHEWRSHSVRATRWGLALIGLGSIVNLIWTAENLVSSVVRLLGRKDFLLGGGTDQLSAVLVCCTIICAGIGVALASSESLVDGAWARILLRRLTPLWSRVITAAPELSLSGRSNLVAVHQHVEDTLYRRWVELLDCERAGIYTPSIREQALMDEVAAAFTGERKVNRATGGIGTLLRIGKIA